MKQQAITLYEAGKTYEQIAYDLAVSRATAVRLLKGTGCHNRGSGWRKGLKGKVKTARRLSDAA